MNATEVGKRLADLYGKNEFETIYAELYSPNIVSIEADGMESKGMEGINAKNEWWMNTFEMLDSKHEGPFPHTDGFAMIYEIKTKHKESGEENHMREVAVYDVEGGKIVRERFFYPQD